MQAGRMPQEHVQGFDPSRYPSPIRTNPQSRKSGPLCGRGLPVTKLVQARMDRPPVLPSRVKPRWDRRKRPEAPDLDRAKANKRRRVQEPRQQVQKISRDGEEAMR